MPLIGFLSCQAKPVTFKYGVQMKYLQFISNPLCVSLQAQTDKCFAAGLTIVDRLLISKGKVSVKGRCGNFLSKTYSFTGSLLNIVSIFMVLVSVCICYCVLIVITTVFFYLLGIVMNLVFVIKVYY